MKVKRPRKSRKSTTAFDVLSVLADLIRGGRHSRTTVVRGWSVSLPTADRWLAALVESVPGVRTERLGKVTWYEWRAPKYALPKEEPVSRRWPS